MQTEQFDLLFGKGICQTWAFLLSLMQVSFRLPCACFNGLEQPPGGRASGSHTAIEHQLGCLNRTVRDNRSFEAVVSGFNDSDLGYGAFFGSGRQVVVIRKGINGTVALPWG